MISEIEMKATWTSVKAAAGKVTANANFSSEERAMTRHVSPVFSAALTEAGRFGFRSPRVCWAHARSLADLSPLLNLEGVTVQFFHPAGYRISAAKVRRSADAASI